MNPRVLLSLSVPFFFFFSCSIKHHKTTPVETSPAKEDSWTAAKKECEKEKKPLADKKARLYLAKLQKHDISPYSYFTPVEYLDIQPTEAHHFIHFSGCKSRPPEGPDGVIFGSTPQCTFECTFSNESNRIIMNIDVPRDKEELDLVRLIHIDDV